MRKVVVFLSMLALAVAVAIPAGAQTNSKHIAQIYAIKAKPGEAQQWEAAAKKLLAWEHQRNMPGTFHAWTVISGEHLGDYGLGTFGHAWADFDALHAWGEKAGVGKEIGETVAPYTESVTVSYYRFLPDVSTPITRGQPAATMSEVTFFNLKPGGMEPVMNAIKQAGAAIRKTHWKGNGSGAEWYVLVNGGEGPQLVLSIGLKNWAALQESSPSFEEMLVQTYGEAGAHAIEHQFDSHVRSEYSNIIRYRPDITHNAPAK